MSESSVRVGLRIRPLVPRERDNRSSSTPMTIKGQTFTFDHVFGMELSQNELYERTAAPMLKSFLEGYNCTIMAYGQTGSGKTYTMGTADTGYSEIESQGLIPRFVADLFENLNNPTDKEEETSYKIKVSFLEIYGEDVFDLLSASSRQTDVSARTSLPVREDENGKVFVQGQTDIEVKTPQSTLEVLNMGSHNRVTAATAMNAGSSRSHAVFTILLEQRVKSAGSEDDVHCMTSRLTFVDLAGSERIKRTGAEGQRMKEGIQINSGLFNLGQVINCLADEQKLKTGNKSTFVPYRNSKLTHLLKDALGGNSQTLFLACVSPAESNENETHSTLNYARQARNIRNKPVRNMDKTQIEMRKLKYAMKAWMMKAVTLMFAPKPEGIIQNKSPMKSAGVLSPAAATFEACCQNNVQVDEEELLRRPEVIEFINSVNASIAEKLDGIAPSPRKVRLSTGVPIMPKSGSKMFSPNFASPNSKSAYGTTAKKMFPDDEYPMTEMKRGGRESILFSADLSEAMEAANQIEGTEELVERMMDMVNKEKKLLGAVVGADSLDANDANGPAIVLTEEAAEEIFEVDRLIQEKEEILNKLMDNIKGYSVLKSEFEKLLDAINGLEEEKKQLENELEKAKKSNQSSASIEKMKERFSVVKKELDKMREDRKSKEQAYRVMQRESKQCESMQKELQKLKEAKVALMKQQKTQFQQLQKLKKESAQKISTFKKNDVRKQQQVNNLKTELVKKERILGLKEREIGRISMKLKACEEHITQLLKIQNRNRNKGPATGAGANANNNNASGRLNIKGNSTANGIKGQLDSIEYDHLMTSKALLEQVVLSQVDKKISQQCYTKKVAQLKGLNAELLIEANKLDTLLSRKNQIIEEFKAEQPANTSTKEMEVALEDMEIMNLEGISIEAKYELESIQQDILLVEDTIDLISKDIDECNVEIDELSLRMEQNHSANNDGGDVAAEGTWDLLGKEIISGLSTLQSQALVLDLMTDKSSLLEQVQMLNHDYQKMKSDYESTNEKAQKLQTHVEKLRKDVHERVQAIDKQRIMDVWAILKAQKTDTLIDVNSSEASQTAQQVAIQRANDLEKELETVLINEEALKNTLQEKVNQLNHAQTQFEEMQMQLQLAKSLLSNVEQAQANNTSQVTVAGNVLNEEYVNKLTHFWQLTGTSSHDRQHALDYLLRSNQLAQERTLSDAEVGYKAACQDVKNCVEHLTIMSQMLNVEMMSLLQAFTSTYSLDDICHTIPKLQALSILHPAQSHALSMCLEKVPKLSMMKDSLLEMMSEMWLEIQELPSTSLRHLAQIKFNALMPCISNTEMTEEVKLIELLKVAKQCVDHNVTFLHINIWDTELKKLNLQRVQITNALIALRTSIINFMQTMEFTNTDSIQSLLSATLANDPEMSTQTINILSQVLGMKSASNPPGSQKLLNAMEKVQMLLQSVQVNRNTVASHLMKYIDLYTEVFEDVDFVKDSSLPVPVHDEDYQVFAKSQLQRVFTSMRTISEKLNQSRLQMTTQMKSLLQSMTNHHVQKIEDQIYQFLQKKTQNIHRPALDQLSEGGWKIVLLSEEVMEELSAMSMFIEEGWIQESIQHLADHWNAAPCDDFSSNLTSLVSIKILLLETYFLKIELKRLETIHELHNELRTTDNTLIKQITELEEFEHTSKENRAKALSGNSKLLIEEEKYRKNAKKKYEVITEKIVATYARLLALANAPASAVGTGNPGISSPIPSSNADGNIEIKIDISTLSSQTQALCKSGLSKEKIELMRLNTLSAASNNGAAAVNVNAAANGVGAVNASNGSIKRRTSLERENSSKSSSVAVNAKPVASGLSSKSKDSKLGAKSALPVGKAKSNSQLTVATNVMLADNIPSAPSSTTSSASSAQSPMPPAPPSIKSPKAMIGKSFASPLASDSSSNKLKAARLSMDENESNNNPLDFDGEVSPVL